MRERQLNLALVKKSRERTESFSVNEEKTSSDLQIIDKNALIQENEWDERLNFHLKIM
jgi:hypothetical protein